MKTGCFLLLLIIFFTFNIQSQSFWAYSAGSIKEDEIMDMCYDNSGNIITAGYFSGTMQMASGITLNSTSLGNPDVYICKSDANGNVIWAKNAGGSGSDRALSVKTDASGNIYITGFYYGTATFGSTTLSSITGSQDAFIAKINPLGTFMWAKSIGGNLAEWGNSITVDNAGNPIVTGQFQGTCNFGGTSLTSMVNPITSFSSFDVFVAKYNSAGVLQFVNQGKAKYDDRGLDVITDNSNNIYVCGQFSDTIQFQNTHNNPIMNASFIIKYNSSGNELWFRKATGVSSIPYDMAMDNSNNIYVTGDFNGTLAYFDAAGTSFVNDTYNNKAFLLKIDNSGNFIWGKSESSDNYVSGKKVAIDNNQDPYLFGEFGCTMNEYADLHGQGVFNSIGFSDFFITKYDKTGTRQWYKQYGGPRNDKAHGLIVKSPNEPIMAGSFEHHLNMPSTGVNINLINDGNYTIYTPPLQPNTYCSASNNYNQYSVLPSRGYSDGFIFKGYDLMRNPYDYYTRSGTACNLGFVRSCIDDSTFVNLGPDTINICLKGYIHANSNAGTSHRWDFFGNGPIQTYLWDNAPNDSLRRLFVNSNGTHTVKVKTLDGCYQSEDTVYVIIKPVPQAPVISDNFNFNTLQPPLTDTVHICGPATVTLTGGNLANTTYSWLGNSYITHHDSVATVNTSGTYTFEVVNSDGCRDSNTVMVIIDSPFNQFVPKQKVDSIEICQYEYTRLIICDTITNPNLIYTYPLPNNCIAHNSFYIASITPGLFLNDDFPLNKNCDLTFNLSATATGNYSYTVGYLFNNLCGIDTVFYSDEIYVKVKSIPAATFNLSGNPRYCPGDSTLFSYNNIIVTTTNTIYNPIPALNNWIKDSAYHYFNFQLIDTLSGCIINNENLIHIYPKSNPLILVNPNNSIICPNDSVQLVINSSGAINYEWHGPSGLIPLNQQSIYSQQNGFYHCIVTDSTGCVFTTNTVEIKQYATPYLISTPTNIICNGNAITLHAISLDDTQIIWNLPLLGGSATQTVSTPGLYSCQITMCNITSSVSINIIGSSPNASITVLGSTNACPYDSIQLHGNTGMANYVWYPSYQSGQTIMAHSAGCYTLEVTDIYGCQKKSAPVCITFTSSVVPPINAQNDTICIGYTANLSATQSGTNAIEWFSNSYNGSNSLNSGATYTTPVLLNQTTYYASSVSNTGCHSIGTPVTAFIFPTSAQPVIVADDIVCKNDSILIFTPLINGASYSYTTPSMNIITSNSIVLANADSTFNGIYSLQIQGNGCTSPVQQVSITVVNPLPISITANDSICENSNYFYELNTIDSTYTYEWSFNGTPLFTSDSLLIDSAQLFQSGIYSVQGNLYSCLSPISELTLTIIPTPETPVIIGNTLLCVGSDIELSLNNVTGLNYQWSSNIGFTSTNDNIIITTDSIGMYQFNVFTEFHSCVSSIVTATIHVLQYPTLITTPDTIACSETPLLLTSNSNFSNYYWNDGTTNAILTTTTSGTYWVTTYNQICSVTDSIHVIMSPCNQQFINVFSPNGDGVNDVFRFNTETITSIHCEIRNRWGNVVGVFNDNSLGWDGTNMNNGFLCNVDSYFYVATIKTVDGLTKTYNGFISLFR